MPAYAYPITVKTSRLKVSYIDTVDVDGQLTLEALAFAGDDSFDVYPCEFGSGYIVMVSRSRLETKAECTSRVAKELQYMEEYNKRHPK